MDDRGNGFGELIARLGGCAVPALSLLLAVILVGAAVGVAVSADGDPAITAVPGKKFRMADAVMADRVIRFTDPAGDQLTTDGEPADSAPDWSDIASVHVASTRLPAKLRTKMLSDHPQGASDAFYGSIARPRAKERIVFVAVKMAKSLPGTALGQVVEVGIAGDAATPVQAGTAADTRAGVESFSLSGRFSNGAMATGETDVIGKEPGAQIDDADYYDLESGVFGYYDARNATWYVVVPRAADTDDITVGVRSTTGAGLVIDRLDLPGGGHFIDLRTPTGGFRAGAELPHLGCRSLETFSSEGGTVDLSDPDATLVRYTAGVDPALGENKTSQMLGPAIEAAGPISVALTAVGSEAAPEIIEGELAVAAEGHAVVLTFEAPAGQWTFELADDLQLVAGSGEPIVDHGMLTGPAGFRIGPGLDGLVAGDASCIEGEVAADVTDAGEPASDGEAADASEPGETVEPDETADGAAEG